MLEAKCPNCGKKAEVNDEMTEVKCGHCGFFASYDDYIEIMKGRAVDISEQLSDELGQKPYLITRLNLSRYSPYVHHNLDRPYGRPEYASSQTRSGGNQ